ncbi:hypothetical protein [Aeromonas bestiarum]|uniref:Uncharacterized protein n=1 Tax=Aeromonas bestiarum TaxID=105751 RepID=A0ABT7Q0Q5_9GAMM|nr:hypothetical protein [Aeromonas bestiarum]MDM5072718.1 hypothetical protein [Aeromonas bestiarum]
MTSHTLSLSLCLFCFSYLTQQTFQLGKGLSSGRKKGLRREAASLDGQSWKRGWQNVAQVLPKLGREGK